MENMLNSYKAGLALGGSFQALDQMEHERAVNGKMNEILGAVRERGGDITMIDSSMYSDRVGLEAMGRVAKQLADTEEYKTRIMGNNIAQARHRYGVFQQYMSDIDSAVKEGDQQRVLALMGSMAAQSGTPYRFSPTEDGQVRVGFITPDGEQEKGTMTMLEAYNMLKPYVKNKGRFIRDSVMHESVTQEENLEYLMNPSKWRTGMDARGNQYTMIPQRIMRNGQLVAGFLVAGPGGQRNMTAEEVAQAGLLGSAGGGLRTGGAGGVDKNAAKIIDAASTVVDPETGEKRRDPYMAKALTMLTQQMGDPDSAMMALQEWERVLAQDEAVAERLAAMPAGQKAMAIIEIMQQQARPAQKQKSAPQKGDDRAGLHARIRDAAAGKGKPDRIATMPAHQSGSFGLYPWNQ